MPVLSPQLASKLAQLLAVFKRRKLLQRGINWLPLCISTMAILLMWTQSWLLSSTLALLVLALTLIALSRTKAYRDINITKMLLHYNRQFPELEESAQLLLVKPSTLMQSLQAQKIEAILTQLIVQKHGQLLPHYSITKGILKTLATITLLFAIWYIDLSAMVPGQDLELTPTTQVSVAPLSLLSTTLSVTAPAYSQLPVRLVSELDLALLSGSKVLWQLTFADPNRNYYIQFDGGERQALSKQSDLSFTFEKIITGSGVYSIGSDNQTLKGVFTLSVSADEKPTIEIISPQRTVTEYPKNLQPEITAEVEINDDFGLSKIEIIASIAKGSGEAVKFRDQLFSFDTSAIVEGKRHYYKTWRLAELGMEPGDEMYFSVKARDNREPEPQHSRSQTKIIRWIEEERNLVLSDGILIDFMPEYFKSQIGRAHV